VLIQNTTIEALLRDFVVPLDYNVSKFLEVWVELVVENVFELRDFVSGFLNLCDGECNETRFIFPILVLKGYCYCC